MNLCRLSGSFSVFRLPFLVAMLVVLAGCSSSMSRVETWQGNPAQAMNAATLSAPGGIRVIEVNGRSVGNFLMDDLALDYALLPGQNDVVFVYKTIWAKTTVVDNGESKVDVVESKPQLASFDARPGTVYQFRFDKPTTRREAERETRDFSAEIVTSAGQTAALSTNYVPSQALARTPVPGTAGVQATSVAAQGNVLDTLKGVWANASDEEKKNFLRWAFE